MRHFTTKRSHRRRQLASGCIIVVGLAFTASCGNDSSTGAERLPGHSRPILEHDWPHPRDYRFEASEFDPSEPSQALLELDNDLRSYVVTDTADPLVRISAALPLGRLIERVGEAGAADALLQLMTTGASSASRSRLSLRLESLATDLTVERMPDGARISLEVMASDWREGLALMLDRIRAPELGEAADHRTGPGYSPTASVAVAGFRPQVELARLLGGYPLAPPEEGTTVSAQAVRALASRTLRPDRVVLGIGGGVGRQEVEEALRELSRGWNPALDENLEIATTPSGVTRSSLHTIDVPGLVGWVAFGKAIGPVPQADHPALAVLAQILNVRLNIAVRERRGLANRAVFVLPEAASGSGLLHFRTGGRPESVAPLIKYCLEEVSRMRSPDARITDEEMEQAKGALLLGQWQRVLDGARQSSATYAFEAVRHGGTDRLIGWPEAIQAVTPDQVKQIAERYLDPSQMVTVLVGPILAIREARHPRWPADLDELFPSSSGPS